MEKIFALLESYTKDLTLDIFAFLFDCFVLETLVMH